MLSTCLFFRFSENLVKNCGENQKFPLLPITNVVLGHVAIVSISHSDQPPPPKKYHPLFRQFHPIYWLFVTLLPLKNLIFQ